MPEIKFLNVTKRYGKIIAVENLNLTIKDGEYLSLLGPSGCGKTTTLRMLSGLILPTEGQILWDDQPVQDLPPDERDIGYVFQQFAIFPHMNLWENIAYPLEVKGVSKPEVEQTVAKYLNLVGLDQKAHLFPRDVSAADLQRTGVARVLARGAKVLLLDEPFGALDQKVREQFQDELRGIVKQLGLTAIHVTHDQSEAMAISDRIGVMKKGKMIQLSSPTNLLFNPRQIFAAHFIGEANFLGGIIMQKSAEYIEVELIGGNKLRASKEIDFYTIGDRVVLGFRKGFAKILHSPPNHINYIEGEVLSDRYLGEKRRINIELPYGRDLEIMALPHEPRCEEGSTVYVEILPENIIIYRYPRYGLEEALEVT
ncbi:MAG: ABC transporter ATP-binding protein [Candidatus Heimdallarchaeota archaeon]|nr:ABC transporter ATP-binding protein [Candidatus Heimdallarchaeota archaeon]